MVKQREDYRIVRPPKWEKRINDGKCPVCGKPKNEWNRRTDWTNCSTECTDKYNKKVIYGWTHLRDKVLMRDNFNCVKCGITPMKITYVRKEFLKKGEKVIKEFTEFGTEYVYVNRPNPSKLVADHIIPIALGGSQWEINNIQTLCDKCNKIKTKQDHEDIAKLRRSEILESKGQKKLI